MLPGLTFNSMIYLFISYNLSFFPLINFLLRVQSTTWVKKESEIEAAKDTKKGEFSNIFLTSHNFLLIDNL